MGKLMIVKKGEQWTRSCKVINLKKKHVEISNTTLIGGVTYGYVITLDLSTKSEEKILCDCANRSLIQLRNWLLKGMKVKALEELIDKAVDVEAHRPEGGQTVDNVTKAERLFDKMSRNEKIAFVETRMGLEREDAIKFVDSGNI